MSLKKSITFPFAGMQKRYRFVHSSVASTSLRIKKAVYPERITLEAVAFLEKRYWKVLWAYKRNFYKKWRPALKAIERGGGKAHCKVTHKYSGDFDPWWLYETSDRGVSFKWVDKPSSPLNLKAGQRFYHASQYSDNTVGMRRAIFRDVLEKMFEDYLWEKKNLPKKHGTILRLILNNRDYWYHSVYNKFGVLMWQKLCWSEDETITKEANDEMYMERMSLTSRSRSKR